MKSSYLKGFCDVCGHSNGVHASEVCIAKGCRQRIKVCGASYHYCGGHQDGDVVCKECPYHGRTSINQSYEQSPVIGKDENGNLRIMKEGRI